MKQTTALRKIDAKLARLEHVLLMASVDVLAIQARPVASGQTFQRTVQVSLRDENGKVVRDADTRKVVKVPVVVTCVRTVSQDWKAVTRKRRTAARKLREAEYMFSAMAVEMSPQEVVAALR
jgi:hypothetical protein